MAEPAWMSAPPVVQSPAWKSAPPVDQAQTAPANISWSDVPGMAMGNLGPSAVQMVEDTIQPFMHPIETAKSLGNLGLGVIQKAIPGEQSSEKYADAVGAFFADRYGGIDEFKNTLATDPAGVIADLSTVFSGGGGLAARAPGMVGKAGLAASRAANMVDPIALAAKAGGRVLSPKTRPSVLRLMSEGVTPTAGQILGGGWKKAEDIAASVPVLGSAVASGRQRANLQLNKAAYNRAIDPIRKYEPIGQHTNKMEIGAPGIADVSDRLSAAYGALLPKVTLKVDNQLIDDIVNSVDDAKLSISDDVGKALERTVDAKVIDRLASGNLSGEQLKILQNDINDIASKYRIGNASEQMAGSALGNIQSAIRQALARANPQFAVELKAIDTGYANYARLRRAGGAAGADTAGFTPAQLRAAVKAEDKSIGKGDTARGRALMQDLSMDAREVLGNDLPNSGTADRAIFTGGLATGALFEPMTAALIASASLPYLPGAQRVVAQALSGRPSAVRAAGNAIGQYGPTVGRAAFQAGRLDDDMQPMPMYQIGQGYGENMVDALSASNLPVYEPKPKRLPNPNRLKIEIRPTMQDALGAK